MLVGVADQRDDDPELHQLGRLQLEAAGELEPRLRTAGVRTERREHGEQTDHRRDVREHRVVAQPPVVDGEQQRHHDQPDEDGGALALHEVELVDPLEPQALSGRRVDHQHAERGNRERRADEQRVEVAQHRPVEGRPPCAERAPRVGRTFGPAKTPRCAGDKIAFVGAVPRCRSGFNSDQPNEGTN